MSDAPVHDNLKTVGDCLVTLAPWGRVRRVRHPARILAPAPNPCAAAHEDVATRYSPSSSTTGDERTGAIESAGEAPPLADGAA
jgi:hypothetical protein